MTTTRRLAAILAADVAGYSRLMGADETGTLQAFKTIKNELFDPTIAAHNGRLVKTTGDGFLVEFSSVVDALRCASEVQAHLAERNATIQTDKRIDFRIGIMMRGKICWLRDLGRESEGGGGASPCHSHKPDSLLSVLIRTASAESDIGASSVTATASLYAWPMDPRCLASMPTIPSQLQRQHPACGPSALMAGLGTAPVSKQPLSLW